MQMAAPLYDSAYQLFATYIYGNPAVLTADQTLVLTALSTMAALAVIAIPFFVIFSAMRFIFGWR